MATPLTLTVNLESNAAEQMRQLTASITASLSGIDAKMQDTAQKTGQAAGAFGTNAAKMAAGMAPLAKEIRVAATGANDLSGALLKTGQAVGATTAQLRPLAGAYGAAGAAAKKAADESAKANQQWTHAGTLIPRLGAAFSSFNTILRSTAVQVAAGLGITAGITGLIQMGKSLVDAGLQMERFERTLQAATGSSRGAQQAFQFITAESNRLGQSITEMVPIFVQLTAATRNTVLEGERTRELFSALAGAGQAVGLSTEAVGGAMLGLTQIISQNAIQLDEFRTQFASRIPGAMLETAKALKTLGVTQRGTIAEMLQGFNRGRISVDDLTKAVTMGLREIQRTAPDMANAVQAAFNQLSNAVFQLMADIAKSGLLDVLARIARFVGREAQGLGRALNIANIADIEQLQRLNQEMAATIKLRDEAQKQAAEPSRLETAKGMLGWETAKQQVEGYNAALAETQVKIDALTQSVGARQKADAAAEKLRSDRVNEENRQNKELEEAEKRRREGAQDSAARARANVGLTQERINQEKIALEQMQALREQALERDYTAAVATTEQTKAAQEAIETAFAIRRVDIARQAALEDAKLQERAAIEGRDARIAAIKAADSAAQASAAAPGATAEAQVNANKRSAASTLELQTVNLAAQNAIAEATKKRTEAQATYEKDVSAIIKGERADQVKITEQSLQREAELRQQALQGQASIISAETELVAAQVDGLILTREEGIARTHALEVQALENRRAQLEQAYTMELDQLQRRVDANQAAAEEITALQANHQRDVQALNIQQQTLEQTHRNQLLEGWITWVRDVKSALGNFLFDWMNGEVDSIKDVLDGLKSYFFKLIADMIAYAATNAIIVPIVGSMLGGFGGGGAGGAAGTALQGAGVLSQLLGIGGGGGAVGSAAQGFGIMDALGITTGLKTISAGLGVGVDMLTDALVMGAGRISQFFGGGAVGTWDAATVTIGGATNLGGAAAGIGGGLAALGAGIYSALNAANTASRAAFAASAAAGAVATTSAAAGAGLLGASAATGALTGWTGIGLIVAAVMAVIGTVLDKVIKPEGPTVAVGAPGGLNVGAEGGRLQVRGDAGSRVFRREGVDPGMARGIQAQLEEGITNAAIAAIDTINAVALDPEALLGPTQAALQAALKNVATINSSNAKKMEQDLSEQLRFANVQFIGGLLEPINRAFDQLRDMGDLEEQIMQLPGKTAGLIAIFTNLNQQLGEMGGSRNTDVLRQLSAVKNQVENFGNRIAGTAGQIAEEIVTSIIEQMQQTVVPTLAGQITQFSGLMNESFRALSTLRATQQMLEGAGLQGGQVGAQIDRLTKIMSETAERISTEIVSGALRDLAEELNQILVQPLRVQATTVNSLFTDSLAALNALFAEWHRLEAEGIDATRVQEQFDRLLGGMLDSVQRITTQAFSAGTFTEFLRVLLAIPEALTNLNPVTQQIRQMGLVFAQIAGPIQEVIDATRLELQTPTERAGDAAMRITELNAAIAQTGDSIDQALPLYGQLAQAIQASAQAQIEVVNEQAEAQTTAIQEAYDAHLEAIRTWAEASIAATNAYFDAETRAYDDWFDTHLEVINAAFDEELAAWDRWAETMMQGLQAFVDASTTMINDLADQANTTASQVETLNRAVLAELSPAEQRSTLEARRDVFRAQAAGGGPGAEQAMTELISINQDLLSLAKQSDNLALQKQATDELKVLQKIMTDQLVAQTGESDPVLAQIKVALIQERYLKDIADYQKAQTEYITQTQQAAIEALEQRREDYLATMEIIRVRVQEAFELARNLKLDEIEASRAAQEDALAQSRDDQLKAVVDWQEATVRAIKEDMVYQLELVQYELQKMFAMQYQVLTGIALAPPTPPLHPSQRVTYDPTVPRHPDTPQVVILQHGGPVGLASGLYYAQGGMVPAMLEPGEHVMTGPFSMAQQGALMSMNSAFPRFAAGGFTVPGSGSGDTVPSWLPSGSFVMNRSASRAMGYQGGGTVHGSSAPAMPPIVIDLRGSRFGSVEDAHKVKDILEKDVVRIMEEYQKKVRVNTRIR